ncbi:MAG: hypothetical protein NVS3B10_22810 [Polyangiales bacterium]
MTTLAAARAPARIPLVALVAPLVHALRILVFVAMAIGLAGWMLLGVIGAALEGAFRRSARARRSADRRR